jgi:hypothetical protein
MPITRLQDSSYQVESSSSTAYAISSSEDDSVDGVLHNLASSIHAGNLSHAQKYLDEVKQLLPSDASQSSSLDKFLTDVSNALSVGSISDAQGALSLLGDHMGDGQTASSLATESDAAILSNSQDIGQQVYGLLNAIDSGDINSVKQAYNSLSLPHHAALSDNDSALSSINGFLQGVATALDASSIGAAQEAKARFLDAASSGVLAKATA